jgi:hypothetical protein
VRQDELRSVLLVKAIEEADRAGTLIPPADRAAAAREARRGGSDAAAPIQEIEQGTLSEPAQRLLVARTRILLGKIVARHSFVDTLRDLAGGPAWAGWILVALGLLLGVALSALDGTRRINILAFPLLGLVLWNLAVYVAIFVAWTRPRPTTKRPRLPEMLARLGMDRVSRLVAKSRAFHAALAEALGRFIQEWFEVARPLLLARATRVFHLSAAAVGIGLILGLYLRGIAFDYQAGWESTFFDASRVRAALSLFYGPASLFTGIPIPDIAHLEAIRWKDGAGGERAAPWIHLLAATAALFVVLPRIALALLATISISRWSCRAPLPPSLIAYFRTVFGASGGAIGRGIVTVIPYAYEPSEASRAGLRALLLPALGESLTLDARAPVRYGDEDEFLQGLGDAGKPEVVVLLFNLSATPEEENHGAVIAGVRDWLAARHPHAQLLVLVDEGPYAARMAADGGADARVAQRRHAWQQFVAAHGLGACTENLAATERDETAPRALTDRVRNALWQPQSA